MKLVKKEDAKQDLTPNEPEPIVQDEKVPEEFDLNKMCASLLEMWKMEKDEFEMTIIDELGA